jgi:hypothetical protein
MADGISSHIFVRGLWRGKQYASKQVEVLAVEENDRWIAITVLVKFF